MPRVNAHTSKHIPHMHCSHLVSQLQGERSSQHPGAAVTRLCKETSFAKHAHTMQSIASHIEIILAVTL